MIDEPLPATERTDAEPKLTEYTDAEPKLTECDAADREGPPSYDGTDRDASDRGPREEPDRATDPPPDRPDGDAACERDREPDGEGDDSVDPDAREYRLERLRLWRTVVTLAVVVARLIRSL
ncbi:MULTISPECIES: hypothetical protein [Halorubrum]|uniref:Uncharacterized protein n=1 Tax=Halorubrum ruber TaxID=2982524 RepID=A0A8T8LNQ0_9EURY|nr:MULTISPECIES: hypothetical protein [Halorubrum]QUO48081.1 hypothetical protein J7656_01595 [Halorubrum ruber]